MFQSPSRRFFGLDGVDVNVRFWARDVSVAFKAILWFRQILNPAPDTEDGVSVAFKAILWFRLVHGMSFYIQPTIVSVAFKAILWFRRRCLPPRPGRHTLFQSPSRRFFGLDLQNRWCDAGGHGLQVSVAFKAILWFRLKITLAGVSVFAAFQPPSRRFFGLDMLLQEKSAEAPKTVSVAFKAILWFRPWNEIDTSSPAFQVSVAFKAILWFRPGYDTILMSNPAVSFQSPSRRFFGLDLNEYSFG